MFDREEVENWLALLHGDSPGRVAISGTDAWAGRSFAVDQLDQAAAYAQQLDAEGRAGVYVRMTTITRAPARGERGGANLSAALPALWADLDIDGPGHKMPPGSLPLPPTEAAARSIITTSGLPDPSLWIHSGGGLYPIWYLTTPHVIDGDLDQLAALSAKWQHIIGASATRLGWHYGTGVGDLARVLRLPGSVNRKTSDPRPCRIIEAEGASFTLGELLDAAAAIELPTATPPVAAPAAPRSRDVASRFKSPGGSGPFDALAEHATWADILAPEGWTLVAHERTGAELWKRPGDSSSAYSARANINGVPSLVVHSDAAGLPSGPGQRLTMGRVWAHLHHHGDEQAAARDLAAAAAGTAGASRAALALPGTVLAAIRGTRGVRVPAPRASPENPPPRAAPSTEAASAAPVERRLALVDGTAARALPDPEPDPGPAAALPVSYSDDGNAVLLVDAIGDRVRYVPERGLWLTWDGARWVWDTAGTVIEHARRIVRAMPADDDAARKHRSRSLGRSALEAMVALARTDRRVVAPAALLDGDPFALCTPGGTVDLRTGALRPSDPGELHTRSALVTPDPGHPVERWSRFLADTFGGDPALAGYVQRLVGYSATGRVTHHVLPFLHGSGGNGKSVFMDVVKRLLGTYAGTAPAGFLMSGREQHETEVARLDGMRFVICSEVNQADRFDEAKIKLLTGGDELTARFLHKNHFEFVPSHTLWLMGNHQPSVKAGGVSFWRRLRLVPFTRTVPEEQREEGLADRLVEQEGPGILAWIIAGAIDALAHGLRDPDSVRAATADYAAEEDHLARFADDRLHIGGGALVRASVGDVRAAYESWCAEEGERPISSQMFGRELRTRYDVQPHRSNGRRFYLGVTLLEAAPESGTESGTASRHWADR
ncbi:phage/plasmid primase, P4 family [Longispora albida]|uniref:phage/plasmid primase, P4 family n=1 Tax=Longispora albida TaxID=203523 RepID=UPI000374A17C|nr:phage/plasmid primase, P4 family [Longispora albida]